MPLRLTRCWASSGYDLLPKLLSKRCDRQAQCSQLVCDVVALAQKGTAFVHRGFALDKLEEAVVKTVALEFQRQDIRTQVRERVVGALCAACFSHRMQLDRLLRRRLWVTSWIHRSEF